MVTPPHDGDELVHDSTRHPSKVMLRLLTRQGLLQLVDFCPRHFLQKGEGRHLQGGRAGDPPTQGHRTHDSGIEGRNVTC